MNHDLVSRAEWQLPDRGLKIDCGPEVGARFEAKSDKRLLFDFF